MANKLESSKKSHSAIATANAYRAALARLVRFEGRHPSHTGREVKITPASVAREAGRSRNPLYSTHRDILEEILTATELPVVAKNSKSGQTAELIAKNKELRSEISRLTKDKQMLATENLALLHRTLTAEERVKTLSRSRPSVASLPSIK